MKCEEVINITGRYILLIVLAIGNLSAFYIVFTPLTAYPVFSILKLFYPASLLINTSTLSISGLYIELIPACIAGAAYYLLLILNLATSLPFKTRIKSLAFLVISFLILNIIRILVFSWLFISGNEYFFDIAHRFVWYIGSTILVLALWFLNVWLFKIKSIPVYTDIRAIIKSIKR